MKKNNCTFIFTAVFIMIIISGCSTKEKSYTADNLINIPNKVEKEFDSISKYYTDDELNDKTKIDDTISEIIKKNAFPNDEKIILSGCIASIGNDSICITSDKVIADESYRKKDMFDMSFFPSYEPSIFCSIKNIGRQNIVEKSNIKISGTLKLVHEKLSFHYTLVDCKIMSPKIDNTKLPSVSSIIQTANDGDFVVFHGTVASSFKNELYKAPYGTNISKNSELDKAVRYFPIFVSVADELTGKTIIVFDNNADKNMISGNKIIIRGIAFLSNPYLLVVPYCKSVLVQ